METAQRKKITAFELVFFLYVLSIEIFSYRSGFVFITYGLFALIILLTLPKSGWKKENSMLFRYMFILVIAFGLSTIFSAYISNSIRRWVTMLLMLLTCWSIEIGFKEKNSQEFFDFFCSVVSYTAVISFFYDFVSIGPSNYISVITQGTRLTDVASQTNVAGVYGAIALNILVFKTIFQKQKKMIFLYPFPILMVMASQSKKAILCVITGILVMLALRYRHKKIAGIIVLLTVVFLFMYLTTLPIFESLLSRFTTAFDTFSSKSNQIADWSTYYRMQMIKEAMQLFMKRPIIGYGVDSFQFVSSFGTYSHNNYFELLANNGIVGFAAYYWIYIYAICKLIRRVIKDNDSNAILLLALLVTTLLMDYGEVSYYNKMTYIYISWVLVYLSKKQKENINVFTKEVASMQQT